MNCSEFQQQLRRTIETHGSTGPALSEHASCCEADECCRAWREYHLLEAATRAWRESLPEADLRQRVVNELLKPVAADNSRPLQLDAAYRMVQQPSAGPVVRGRWTQRDRTHSWGAVATVSAALLLVISLLTLRRPESGDLAANGHDSPSAIAVTADENEAHKTARSDTYAAMPLMATKFMTDAVVFVVPADLGDPDAEPGRADVWADHIEQKLEPIGKELSSAFEAFLQAVPKPPTSST